MNEEFEDLELIGRGSFGQIRKVRRCSDNRVLVRKEISYKTMNHKEKDQLLAEFRILKSLVHPNVVQYLHRDHDQTNHVVHLYMEYCGGGDLAGLIRQCRERNERVPEKIVWSIFTQLILALYRCHFNTDPPAPGDLFCLENEAPPPQPSTVILHRDIKPDNVFLDSESNVKLGDFGLAKMLDQENLMANTYVGTPYYMSPEVLMDHPYTPQSDIWSLGCVIYELCTFHPPFQAKSHLVLSQKIREGVYPALPDMYSSTLNKTIAACINISPQQRPTTDTLLRLDVIKLCRRERELTDWERHLRNCQDELIHREQLIMEREQQLADEAEMQRKTLEQEYQRMESEYTQYVEKEVARRVGSSAPVSAACSFHETTYEDFGVTTSEPVSPSDTTMVAVTPGTAGPRNVRGPRSIKGGVVAGDILSTPLRSGNTNGRHPFDELSHESNLPPPTSPLSAYSKSSSSAGSAATDRSHNTSTTSTGSSYTSNWQTCASSHKKSASFTEAPQRAAPHYNIVHSNGGQGMGAAAAKAKILGAKATAAPGALGRATTAQLQSDKQPTAAWDEQIYGDDMPSPFLRRWERRVEMNTRSY